MAKKEGKKKSKLGLIVPVVVLVVGLFVGKTFLGGSGGEAAATGETTTTTEPTQSINLPQQTVTLEDGAAVKIGITLKMSKKFKVPTTVKDDPTGGYPEAMQAAITVFSAQTREPLLTAVGKDAARNDLLKALQAVYPDDVRGVLFWQFQVP